MRLEITPGRIEVPAATSTVLPELTFNLGDLRRDGFQSAGADFIIASLDAAGKPMFLFESCKETAKTFEGQLSHPKETLKIDPEGSLEPLDDAFRRCFRQELGVDLDNVELFVNPEKLIQEAETYVRASDEIKRYRATLLIAWVKDFSWLPAEIDTAEVKGTQLLSLDDVLTQNPNSFRECTVEIFQLLSESGFLDSTEIPDSSLLLKPRTPSNGNGHYKDVNLTQS